MTVEDGLILKGEALIIPSLQKEKILQAIHEGHMGISKSQYNAGQCVYWPGINEDIRKMVEACQHHCLESMKTSGKWLKHAQHANTITHRNQDSHSNQPQHQNAHGNIYLLTFSHLMDLNT